MRGLPAYPTTQLQLVHQCSRRPHHALHAGSPHANLLVSLAALSVMDQKFLERRYPSLIGSIEGGTYPPPPHAQVGRPQLLAYSTVP